MLTHGAARVVLACDDLTSSIDFFTDLGFSLDSIWPADDPAHAILSVAGLRIELRRGAGASCPAQLVVPSERVAPGEVRELVAPDGTVVELVAPVPTIEVPPGHSSLSVSTPDVAGSWVTGRAGMRYRDLLPDRWGGRYIASHIAIPDGGPVPDYVHYHDVRFQMIFCAEGWARLLYEDQGEPFLLHRGDCVLQPPGIRHRVLEASAGLEVVEIGCPAEHLTSREHELELPTAMLRPDRDFAGQRFVRHIAQEAPYEPGVRTASSRGTPASALRPAVSPTSTSRDQQAHAARSGSPARTTSCCSTCWPAPPACTPRSGKRAGSHVAPQWPFREDARFSSPTAPPISSSWK
jgi:quercetin dioxygenase-like cupin family protein